LARRPRDGRWAGLARHQLFEGRDLAVTTDFRTLFTEVRDAPSRRASRAPLFSGLQGHAAVARALSHSLAPDAGARAAAT